MTKKNKPSAWIAGGTVGSTPSPSDPYFRSSYDTWRSTVYLDWYLGSTVDCISSFVIRRIKNISDPPLILGAILALHISDPPLILGAILALHISDPPLILGAILALHKLASSSGHPMINSCETWYLWFQFNLHFIKTITHKLDELTTF